MTRRSFLGCLSALPIVGCLFRPSTLIAQTIPHLPDRFWLVESDMVPVAFDHQTRITNRRTGAKVEAVGEGVYAGLNDGDEVIFIPDWPSVLSDWVA